MFINTFFTKLKNVPYNVPLKWGLMKKLWKISSVSEKEKLNRLENRSSKQFTELKLERVPDMHAMQIKSNGNLRVISPFNNSQRNEGTYIPSRKCMFFCCLITSGSPVSRLSLTNLLWIFLIKLSNKISLKI